MCAARLSSTKSRVVGTERPQGPLGLQPPRHAHEERVVECNFSWTCSAVVWPLASWNRATQENQHAFLEAAQTFSHRIEKFVRFSALEIASTSRLMRSAKLSAVRVFSPPDTAGMAAASSLMRAKRTVSAASGDAQRRCSSDDFVSVKPEPTDCLVCFLARYAPPRGVDGRRR